MLRASGLARPTARRRPVRAAAAACRAAARRQHSRCGGARRWAWSARCGSGKSTWRAASPGWSTPTAATSCSTATRSLQACRAPACGRTARRIQMVFQDPYASLDPRHRVGDLIAEGPIVHGAPTAEARGRAHELLGAGRPRRRRGRPLPARILRRPAPAHRHRPRARAGARRCWSPTSRSRRSTSRCRRRCSTLLAEIRGGFDLSMLFITHDLRVAAQVCDRSR